MQPAPPPVSKGYLCISNESVVLISCWKFILCRI